MTTVDGRHPAVLSAPPAGVRTFGSAGGFVRTARPSLTGRWKPVAASGGRAVLVAGTFAVLEPGLLGSPFGVAFLALVTATWVTTYVCSLRTSRRLLGATVASAFATATASIVVSALVGWVSVASPRFPLLEAAAALLVSSAIWERVVTRWLAPRQRVLVLGFSEAASEILDESARTSPTRFDVVGVVPQDANAVAASGIPLLGTLSGLADVIETHRPDLIVLAHVDPGAAVDQLVEESWRGFRVVDIAHFFEDAFGRVPLGHLTPAWFISILHCRRPCYSPWVKRTYDVLVAAVALVLFSPALAAVALMVRLSGRPVVYRQARLGERGRTFLMLKFRTMVPDAECDGWARWASRNDPRITAVGKVLRRFRIDELPQLWNILRGEMSVVGPRPERPEFVNVLESRVPYWNRRLLLKPGLTGWAQLHAGYADSCEATATKLSYDLWYVRHRTLLLDIAICARTLATVVSGAGAR